MKVHINYRFGQKQRVTIAGILSIDAKYIILDEPTTMLDQASKENMYNILKQLNKLGYTIIYITNSIEEVLIADRIILLEERNN